MEDNLLGLFAYCPSRSGKEKLAEWADEAKGFNAGEPATQQIPEDIARNAKEHGYW
jgi:hypothetical protein